MTIKRILKQIPFAVEANRAASSLAMRLVRGRSNQKIISQMATSTEPPVKQMGEVLVALQQPLSRQAKEWQEKIEAERKRLLGRNELLDDSSLGKTGLFDGDLTVRQAAQVSKPPKQALLLFHLVRHLQPQNVIELGTNLGISAAYIGAALKMNGQDGRVTTLEASPYRLQIAKTLHSNLSLDNVAYVEGLFSDTLLSTLESSAPVDLAFIDGHHQYQPTLDYFEEILRFAAPGATFVFDDIRWSDGMKKAWAQIQADERLGVVVDVAAVGLGSRQPQASRFVSDPIYIF